MIRKGIFYIRLKSFEVIIEVKITAVDSFSATVHFRGALSSFAFFIIFFSVVNQFLITGIFLLEN